MDYTEADTDKVARSLLKEITASPTGATIVALEGDLGAGKTTLAKSLGKILGIAETIVSPTFVIAKFYETNHDMFTTLIHIDAYRIESDTELGPIGFEQMLQQQNTLIIIEWPERIGMIPDTAHRYRISHNGEARRIQKL